MLLHFDLEIPNPPKTGNTKSLGDSMSIPCAQIWRHYQICRSSWTASTAASCSATSFLKQWRLMLGRHLLERSPLVLEILGTMLDWCPSLANRYRNTLAFFPWEDSLWCYWSTNLRLIKDFKRITDQLATSFRALAELKAELLLNEEAESTDELLGCQDHVYRSREPSVWICYPHSTTTSHIRMLWHLAQSNFQASILAKLRVSSHKGFLRVTKNKVPVEMNNSWWICITGSHSQYRHSLRDA